MYARHSSLVDIHNHDHLRLSGTAVRSTAALSDENLLRSSHLHHYSDTTLVLLDQISLSDRESSTIVASHVAIVGAQRLAAVIEGVLVETDPIDRVWSANEIHIRPIVLSIVEVCRSGVSPLSLLTVGRARVDCVNEQFLASRHLFDLLFRFEPLAFVSSASKPVRAKHDLSFSHSQSLLNYLYVYLCSCAFDSMRA